MIPGKGVADALHVKQGDWVSIMIPNADADHQLLQPKRVRLHVTGILQLSGQLDHGFAMIPMQDAQQYPGDGWQRDRHRHQGHRRFPC